ncbi:GUN4 domain-containing protein [Fischerella sp. PCC 9605]|uniref:GUN4 domain-containing protein n=1 Tax=Fischerella sp. PCC 9605 TaxID=1173024 RepID=UPI0004B965A9|nr:GUN4 domain-containing protein [Fischerella sp. PCC 9605]
MSEQDKLLSNVGVDYTPLRDLLVAGQWQKADEETGAVMLKIARRVKDGWLREEDFTEFPCLDLETIDRLWVKYSQGRFGFSVQSRIWESVGQDYAKFGDVVGWQLGSSFDWAS